MTASSIRKVYERVTVSITGIVFSLSIDGPVRHFLGLCDLSARTSPEQMRGAIIERESRPLRAMTRPERLEHIWSRTHDDYRGYADERVASAEPGMRIVMMCVRLLAIPRLQAARSPHRC